MWKLKEQFIRMVNKVLSNLPKKLTIYMYKMLIDVFIFLVFV